MLRAIAAVFATLAFGTAASADDVPVIGTKAQISINNLSGKAKVTSVQKDPGIHYGAGGNDPAMLDASFEAYYVDAPTNRATLPMPAPWFLNNGITARFKNNLAPAGPTPVKAATLKAGRLAKLSTKALGGIDVSTAPGPGGVVTIFRVTNGNDGSTHRFCSRYSLGDASVVLHKTSASGFKLVLKRGVPTACPTCADGVRNALETGIDCGGGSCPSCGDGQGCNGDADCTSGVCQAGTCQPAGCGDGIQNGGESDTDCGGPCPGCADGDSCGSDGDCTSQVCAGDVCQTPSCVDGAENGAETDVDCGGGTCPDCGSGDSCDGGTDCDSGVCASGVCQAAACNDGAQNGGESDVDCGGPCPGCGPGDACVAGPDCTSGVCTGNVCQAPTCADGVENGNETAVDCGGGTCAPCGDGQGCDTAADCAGGVCTLGICQTPTCSDAVENGAETDVDCGGGTCPDCNAGDDCLAASDCASGVCTGNVCQAPACNDGVENGTETDVDCGGDCPANCDPGEGCESSADCTSNVCPAGICLAPTCTDGFENGAETDVDCGGGCPGCADGLQCDVGIDCQSLVCPAGFCQTAQCNDGVQNGGEAGVDCGGPCPACSCQTRGQCRMFVTGITTTGSIGGLAGADIICNNQAASAGLVGTYQAWLCDGVTAPANRSFHATVPYRRTDGALIANNWADLTDGSLANPINRTESGLNVSAASPFLPWTFVTTAGTCDNETYLSPGSGPCPAFSNCKLNCANNGGNNGWTSGSGFAQGSKGDVNATNGNWTDGVTGLCSTPHERIYCIEQ
jgi:hypothetical protein